MRSADEIQADASPDPGDLRMKTDLPCRQSPDMWFSTDARERGRAVHICLEHCSWLSECRTLPPVEGAVLGGVAYTEDRVPARRARPVRCESCGPAEPTDTGRCGSPAGWTRHRAAGEKPCGPCRRAESARCRAWRERRKAA